MVDAALLALTQISIFLMMGIFIIAIAKKLKVSSILFLLLAGFGIGAYFGDRIQFSNTFLVAFAVLTLAIVVFEGTSKLSFRQVDTYSGPAFKLTMWWLLFTVITVGITGYFLLFSIYDYGIIISLILAVAVAGTDPSSVLLILKDSTGGLARLLTLEAVINTPIIVLIPFILLDAITSTFNPEQLFAIITQIFMGVGVGVVFGLILTKVLKQFYSKEISPVAVIATALLAYNLGEYLGGSGVLAVATVGIFFGNFTVKNKDDLQDFSLAISTILEILIYLLIGVYIGNQITITPTFLINSFIIFFVLFLARLGASYITLKDKYNKPEILFCAISMPKGIAVSVLIFSFILRPEIPSVLVETLFAVAIYSILAATIAGFWWNLQSTNEKQPITPPGHEHTD